MKFGTGEQGMQMKRVWVIATLAASFLFGASVSAPAAESFKTMGTDPAGDAVPGADLTYLHVGHTLEGLQMRFGLDGPLTPTDLNLEGTLHWTFWVAPPGGGWTDGPARYGTRRVRDRTYYTVAAHFERRTEPTFDLTQWAKCTLCADWGAVGSSTLTGGYAQNGSYLAIQLPASFGEPGAELGTCANHRAYCNWAEGGRHVFLDAQLPVTTTYIDVLEVSERYEFPSEGRSDPPGGPGSAT